MRDGFDNDDRRRHAEREAGWPRVAMTVIGLFGVTAAVMFVIKAGGAATAVDPQSPPPTRTVTATVAPNAPAASAEVPVRVESVAPAGRAQTDLRQIVYTVAGNQRHDDPVTVVYADETGELRTVENVTLPWTLTINPNLPVNYVTANSRGSQLNCWITDAGGSTVAADTAFGISTTCNR
ncbi:MAG: MmpS family transport accessory protein [Mycobacterium sp.]